MALVTDGISSIKDVEKNGPRPGEDGEKGDCDDGTREKGSECRKPLMDGGEDRGPQCMSDP